jgi:hypothetical protein
MWTARVGTNARKLWETCTPWVKRYDKTLNKIFSDSPCTDIWWPEIVGLLNALKKAKVKIRCVSGWLVDIHINAAKGTVIIKRRDLPLNAGAVGKIKGILKKAGVTPDRIQKFL